VATDWLKLKDEYLHTAIGLKALARQHGVPYTDLQKMATQENWAAMKRAQRAQKARPSSLTDGANEVHKMETQENWAAMKRVQRAQKARPSGLTDGANEVHKASHPAETRASETEARAAAYGQSEQTDRIARLRAIGDQLTDQLARATVELDKQVLKHKRKTREVVYDGMDAKGKPVEETVEENYELEIVDATVSCAGLQKLSATLKNLREATMADAGDGQSVGMVAELMKRLDEEAARGEA